jgi:uncharacterized membrane protein
MNIEKAREAKKAVVFLVMSAICIGLNVCLFFDFIRKGYVVLGHCTIVVFVCNVGGLIGSICTILSALNTDPELDIEK